MNDPFRPLSHDEIRDRIEIVRAAKKAKGLHGNLTRVELTRLLGPSVESSIDKLSGQRRVMAHVKTDNFGVIGVRKVQGSLPFYAYAKRGDKSYRKRFKSWKQAVAQRNAWAEELWPGCPEALCDWDAAREKWGRRKRKSGPDPA